MALIDRIRKEYANWLASVAEAVDGALGRLMSRSRPVLVETEPNNFSVRLADGNKERAPSPVVFRLTEIGPEPPLKPDVKQALRGSRLNVLLHPSRFLFRPLELPQRASEFLEAMVRSQIDRLTPWAAGEAAFGWTPPRSLEPERIQVIVAATAKSKIVQLIDIAEDCHVASLIIRTRMAAPSDESADEITVFDSPIGGSLNPSLIRRGLHATLSGAAILAIAAMMAGEILGDRYDAEAATLTRSIASRRAEMRLSAAAGDTAQARLARRKQTTPSAVMVLEALSAILPDDTYITELRIEKDKLQIVGITQDAPRLVKLIEQSPHFSRAIFFAPTTRGSGDPGDRFHVEAHITPHFGAPT